MGLSAVVVLMDLSAVVVLMGLSAVVILIYQKERKEMEKRESDSKPKLIEETEPCKRSAL